ncbi:cupin domain-containing protein [Geosporobacter ferrireducens]|uniref:Cupin n=1 Tax=Geosporobacter ferrireducens TaxID=1424294 RepID=A0A1D8GK28_9FIRM|nr:cupin domain-containing protein [Geosporobacter ferrireducens]AOT71259.1 cupin [Geosporobacter ferrireducens]MTI58072.1 cupin domain-containing protein [Geosporobacter ferrireducens]
MFFKNEEALVKNPAEGVVLKVVSYGGGLMMTEVTFNKGISLPPHTHVHEQISYIAKGSFQFTLGEETKVVKQGDSIYIPSNIPHCVTALEDAVVVDAFTPQREDFKK